MADRKAQQKYYPPNFDPTKGSLNTQQKQHPLRARARKLDQGILIVRFEMPFNVWCLTCHKMIGQGTRYNAEKKKIGKYFSSPIFEFRMKCAECSGWMTINTDPKNGDFELVDGVAKKTIEWDQAENGTAVPRTAEERAEIAADPLLALEVDKEQERQAEIKKHELTLIYESNEKRWKEPYELNQVARHIFREGKKEIARAAQESKTFAESHSLHVPILPPSAEDEQQARLIRFRGKSQKEKLQRRADLLVPPIPGPSLGLKRSLPPGLVNSIVSSRNRESKAKTVTSSMSQLVKPGRGAGLVPYTSDSE